MPCCSIAGLRWSESRPVSSPGMSVALGILRLNTEGWDMEWESWVWRATGSRWARKSLMATIALLLIWSVGFGPLVAWRQRVIIERMQPIITDLIEVEPVQPPSPPDSPRRPGHSSSATG